MQIKIHLGTCLRINTMFKLFKQNRHRYIVQLIVDGENTFRTTPIPQKSQKLAVWCIRWDYLPKQIKVVATFKILSPQEARKGLDRMHIQVKRDIARLQSQKRSKY